jgi:hypothetical protein
MSVQLPENVNEYGNYLPLFHLGGTASFTVVDTGYASFHIFIEDGLTTPWRVKPAHGRSKLVFFTYSPSIWKIASSGFGGLTNSKTRMTTALWFWEAGSGLPFIAHGTSASSNLTHALPEGRLRVTRVEEENVLST